MSCGCRFDAFTATTTTTKHTSLWLGCTARTDCPSRAGGLFYRTPPAPKIKKQKPAPAAHPTHHPDPTPVLAASEGPRFVYLLPGFGCTTPTLPKSHVSRVTSRDDRTPRARSSVTGYGSTVGSPACYRATDRSVCNASAPAVTTKRVQLPKNK